MEGFSGSDCLRVKIFVTALTRLSRIDKIFKNYKVLSSSTRRVSLAGTWWSRLANFEQFELRDSAVAVSAGF